MDISYQFIMRDPAANTWRRDITHLVTSARLMAVDGAIGAATLSLASDPDDWRDASWFPPDARLYVYRTLPGREPSLLFDKLWLLQRTRQSYDNDGRCTRDCSFVCANDLLRRRIVAYAAASTQAQKVAAFADDMIKEVWRENFGSSATDTTRDLSGAFISIAADTSQGQTVQSSFAWDNVLDVTRDLCDRSTQAGTFLTFDFEATTGTFRTYAGQRGLDRRSTVVFGPERGNLAMAALEYDASQEATRAYAGAQGVEADRNVGDYTDTARSLSSPFRLIEHFEFATQISQIDTTAALQAAYMAVRNRRPRVIISGQFVETPACTFDEHVGFGDYVTVRAFGKQLDARMSGVGLTVQRSGDGLQTTIDVALRSETYE